MFSTHFAANLTRPIFRRGRPPFKRGLPLRKMAASDPPQRIRAAKIRRSEFLWGRPVRGRSCPVPFLAEQRRQAVEVPDRAVAVTGRSLRSLPPAPAPQEVGHFDRVSAVLLVLDRTGRGQVCNKRLYRSSGQIAKAIWLIFGPCRNLQQVANFCKMYTHLQFANVYAKCVAFCHIFAT